MKTNETLTPAAAAKAYAEQHGFDILPADRRYDVWCGAEADAKHIANVGGYPAALNAMKRHV